ncbi:MAG: hypothetical protein WKH64_02545 [Chloroflexia bacterium]
MAAVRNHNFGIPGEVLVTGQTAYDVDVIALIAADAPKAIGFIMVQRTSCCSYCSAQSCFLSKQY